MMPSTPGLNLLPEIKCDVKVLTRYIPKFSLIEAISVPSSILMAMSFSLNLNILPMLLSGKCNSFVRYWFFEYFLLFFILVVQISMDTRNVVFSAIKTYLPTAALH